MGGAKRNRPDGAGAGMPSHGLGYSSCGERRGSASRLPQIKYKESLYSPSVLMNPDTLITKTRGFGLSALKRSAV